MKTIQFSNEIIKYAHSSHNEFQKGLKRLEENYFLTNHKNRYGNFALILKATILLVVFGISYGTIFRTNAAFLTLFFAYIILGIISVMIVLNIVHDAIHHAISRFNWVNKMGKYLGDLVGMNSYIWEIRHSQQHHVFTNILGGDLIIEKTPLIRISPEQPYKKFHRFQIFYAPLFYMLYSIFWVFVIDFKLFFKKDICNLKNIKHPIGEWIKLFVFKFIYLICFLMLPWYFTEFEFKHILICFFFMHFAAGLFMSVVIVLGHFVEGPSFPAVSKGVVDKSFIDHQLDAAIDFAPKSKLALWITGGSNTHVVHHLFPRISHVHYYHLTQLVEAFCLENGYNYQQNTFWNGLKSHFRFLRKLSIPN